MCVSQGVHRVVAQVLDNSSPTSSYVAVEYPTDWRAEITVSGRLQSKDELSTDPTDAMKYARTRTTNKSNDNTHNGVGCMTLYNIPVNSTLRLRVRQDGDKLTLPQYRKSSRVVDVLRQLKCSPLHRDSLPIVTLENKASLHRVYRCFVM